jgi:hypothetical protein
MPAFVPAVREARQQGRQDTLVPASARGFTTSLG